MDRMISRVVQIENVIFNLHFTLLRIYSIDGL